MLLPFLFLVSALFFLPGDSEVVSSFNKCSQFFFKEKFPNDALKPLIPTRICQKYKDKYFFATMYDKTKRIPIYSAYVYNPQSRERPDEWMIEPQLVGTQYGPNMEEEKSTTIPVPEILASQAMSHDYSVAPWYVDRGHLNPVGHQPDDDSKAATFTMTNIVPQFSRSNQGPWKDYETITMAGKQKEFGCTKIYVITGAVPGNKLFVNERVNYPSHVWSAACCKITEKSRVSWGAIADNNWEKPPKVNMYSLKELQQELQKLYKKKKVSLFGGCY